MIRDVLDWFKVMGLVLAYAAVALFMALRAEAQELRATPFQTFDVSYGHETLREGVHSETGELRGCVIYLEGLGDSVLNHEPLFRALAKSGYRTLSFDDILSVDAQATCATPALKTHSIPSMRSELKRASSGLVTKNVHL